MTDSYDLAIVAMQTVQLMGGPHGRRRLLERLAAHLRPAAGRAALAFVTRLATFEADGAALLGADVAREGELELRSRPLAIRPRPGGGFELERLREQHWRGECRHAERDLIELDAVTVNGLEREARAAGLRALARRTVLPTSAHAGSSVVVLGA